MSVSAEMYIVISLMFAVFAAVAAIGTSLVLGVGFERLRAGFEVVKKQTGFFADAIHQLDERTKELDEKAAAINKSVGNMSVRIDRVEKQTVFFADAINSMEGKILQGSPSDPVQDHTTGAEEKADKSPFIAPVINWGTTAETARLLKERKAAELAEAAAEPRKSTTGFSNLLIDYLRSENHNNHSKGVIYH